MAHSVERSELRVGLQPARTVLDNGAVLLIKPTHTTAAVTINLSVLGFSILVSLLTGILFGLVPALRMSRPAVADSINQRQMKECYESD